MKQYPLLLAIVILSLLSGCKKEELLYPNATKQYSGQQLINWTNTINNVIRNASGHVSPIAARDWAFISLAAYEAGVQGMPEKRSLSGQIDGLVLPKSDNNKTYHWGIAVNTAISEVALHMFQNSNSASLQEIIQQENTHYQLFLSETDAATASRSKQFGRDIAAAIISLETTDVIAHQHSRNLYSPGYTLQNGAAFWSPVAPNYASAMLSDWGQVKTLVAIKSIILPAFPHDYSEDIQSTYHKEALEVASFMDIITPDQEHMAEFWNDASPGQTMGTAGRWMAITAQILEQNQSNLAEGLSCMAKVGLAIHDAGVVCWQSKYKYHAKSPQTYIRQHINPNFTERHPGLSGPEYTTEHAVIAGAAAEVLEQTFGKDFVFTDRCHEGRTDFNGNPRTFASIHDASKESALSRMYAGTNYRQSCLEGHKLGTETGRQVLSHIKWSH